MDNIWRQYTVAYLPVKAAQVDMTCKRICWPSELVNISKSLSKTEVLTPKTWPGLLRCCSLSLDFSHARFDDFHSLP